MAWMVLCLAAVALAASGAQGFECPKQNVPALVPDPNDCRKYYHCLPHGRVFEMQCPNGLVFDTRQKVCMWDSKARSCAPDHQLEPIKAWQPKDSATRDTENNSEKRRTDNSRRSKPQKKRKPSTRNRNRNNKAKPVPTLKPRNLWMRRTEQRRVSPTTPPTTTRRPATITTTTAATTTTTRAETNKMTPPEESTGTLQDISLGNDDDTTSKKVGLLGNILATFGFDVDSKKSRETEQDATEITDTAPVTDEFLDAILPREETTESRGADDKKQPTASYHSSSLLSPQSHSIKKRSPEDNMVSDGVQCPSAFAYLADPSDCSVFYHCYHWQPMKKSCPPGLFFDNQNFVCNWPHNVNCMEGYRAKSLFSFNEMRRSKGRAYKSDPEPRTPSPPQRTVKKSWRRPAAPERRTTTPMTTATTTATTTTTTLTPTTRTTATTTKVPTVVSFSPSQQQFRKSGVDSNYSVDILKPTMKTDDATKPTTSFPKPPASGPRHEPWGTNATADIEKMVNVQQNSTGPLYDVRPSRVTVGSKYSLNSDHPLSKKTSHTTDLSDFTRGQAADVLNGRHSQDVVPEPYAGAVRSSGVDEETDVKAATTTTTVGALNSSSTAGLGGSTGAPMFTSDNESTPGFNSTDNGEYANVTVAYTSVTTSVSNPTTVPTGMNGSTTVSFAQSDPSSAISSTPSSPHQNKSIAEEQKKDSVYASPSEKYTAVNSSATAPPPSATDVTTAETRQRASLTTTSSTSKPQTTYPALVKAKIPFYAMRSQRQQPDMAWVDNNRLPVSTTFSRFQPDTIWVNNNRLPVFSDQQPDNNNNNNIRLPVSSTAFGSGSRLRARTRNMNSRGRATSPFSQPPATVHHDSESLSLSPHAAQGQQAPDPASRPGDVAMEKFMINLMNDAMRSKHVVSRDASRHPALLPHNNDDETSGADRVNVTLDRADERSQASDARDDDDGDGDDDRDGDGDDDGDDDEAGKGLAGNNTASSMLVVEVSTTEDNVSTTTTHGDISTTTTHGDISTTTSRDDVRTTEAVTTTKTEFDVSTNRTNNDVSKRVGINTTSTGNDVIKTKAEVSTTRTEGDVSATNTAGDVSTTMAESDVSTTRTGDVSATSTEDDVSTTSTEGDVSTKQDLRVSGKVFINMAASVPTPATDIYSIHDLLPQALTVHDPKRLPPFSATHPSQDASDNMIVLSLDAGGMRTDKGHLNGMKGRNGNTAGEPSMDEEVDYSGDVDGDGIIPKIQAFSALAGHQRSDDDSHPETDSATSSETVSTEQSSHTEPDSATTEQGSHTEPDSATTEQGSHTEPDSATTEQGSHTEPNSATTEQGSHTETDSATTEQGSHSEIDSATTEQGSHSEIDSATTEQGSHSEIDSTTTEQGSHSEIDSATSEQGSHSETYTATAPTRSSTASPEQDSAVKENVALGSGQHAVEKNHTDIDVQPDDSGERLNQDTTTTREPSLVTESAAPEASTQTITSKFNSTASSLQPTTTVATTNKQNRTGCNTTHCASNSTPKTTENKISATTLVTPNSTVSTVSGAANSDTTSAATEGEASTLKVETYVAKDAKVETYAAKDAKVETYAAKDALKKTDHVKRNDHERTDSDIGTDNEVQEARSDKGEMRNELDGIEPKNNKKTSPKVKKEIDLEPETVLTEDDDINTDATVNETNSSNTTLPSSQNATATKEPAETLINATVFNATSFNTSVHEGNALSPGDDSGDIPAGASHEEDATKDADGSNKTEVSAKSLQGEYSIAAISDNDSTTPPSKSTQNIDDQIVNKTDITSTTNDDVTIKVTAAEGDVTTTDANDEKGVTNVTTDTKEEQTVANTSRSINVGVNESQSNTSPPELVASVSSTGDGTAREKEYQSGPDTSNVSLEDKRPENETEMSSSPSTRLISTALTPSATKTTTTPHLISSTTVKTNVSNTTESPKNSTTQQPHNDTFTDTLEVAVQLPVAYLSDNSPTDTENTLVDDGNDDVKTDNKQTSVVSEDSAIVVKEKKPATEINTGTNNRSSTRAQSLAESESVITVATQEGNTSGSTHDNITASMSVSPDSSNSTTGFTTTESRPSPSPTYSSTETTNTNTTTTAVRSSTSSLTITDQNEDGEKEKTTDSESGSSPPSVTSQTTGKAQEKSGVVITEEPSSTPQEAAEISDIDNHVSQRVTSNSDDETVTTTSESQASEMSQAETDMDEGNNNIENDVATGNGNTSSKRSFVSLTDLITWYLKHWRNYAKWRQDHTVSPMTDTV